MTSWQSKSDIGLAVLASIHDLLKVDSDYRVDIERGFTWWPSDYAQTFWVEPADKDGVYRIHCEIDFLKTRGATSDADVTLAQWMTQTTLSGIIFDAEKNIYKLHACFGATADNTDRMKRILLAAAGLQVAEAEKEAPRLAASLHVLAAKSTHPFSAPRSTRHNLVKCEEQYFKPFGAQPCKWLNDPEWEAASAVLATHAELSETDGKSYAWAEIPWEGHGNIRLEITTENAHPLFGNGLSCSAYLPLIVARNDRAVTALKLNKFEREADTGFHALGSWCCLGTDIGFHCFVPNISYSSHVLMDMAKNLTEREEWLRSAFFESFGSKFLSGAV